MLFYSVVVIVLYARRLLTLSVNLMIHLSTAPALQYGYQGIRSYQRVRCPLSASTYFRGTGEGLEFRRL